MTHCVVFDGTYIAGSAADSTGKIIVKNLSGNTAIAIMGGPVTATDVQIIGSPTQTNTPTGTPAGTPIYNNGAVTVSATWGGSTSHPLWHKDTSGLPMLSATNCAIHGWPGPNFTGYSAGGFTVDTRTVTYDPLPAILACEAGKGMAPQALEEQIQSDLRTAVGAK